MKYPTLQNDCELVQMKFEAGVKQLQKEKNIVEIDSNECDAEESHQKINGKKEDVNDDNINWDKKKKR